MALSQAQIALQMIAQLRALDPTVSAEIGTPERKIIDTVAESIAENQIDLNLTSGALDFSAKYGSDLDQFMAVLGFGRQRGAFASGFVTFGRPSPSTYDIVIPRGTQVAAGNGLSTTIIFQTTDPVTLNAGQTSVIAPIQALVSGTNGNVATGQILQFANLGAPPLGITTVLNEVPTTGGLDLESDAEFKVRFKNTVFRNMAGTQDQYLALAIATKFATMANVLGPISRFQEYMQVPANDDASFGGSQTSILANATNGSQTLTSVSVTGSSVPSVGDWVASGAGLQITAIDITGTSYTLSEAYDGTTTTGLALVVWDDASGHGAAGQYTTTPSSNPYSKHTYSNVPHFISNGQLGTDSLFYRQDTDFILNDPPIDVGDTYRESSEGDLPLPSTTPYKPNVTFINVYGGSDTAAQLIRPGDVVLLEYSYMSSHSRNDYTRAISNCVDVFVNGGNPTLADAVLVPPGTGSIFLFTANPVDTFYNQNFRRLGEPYTVPVIGNAFQALFWQPVIELPDQIVAGLATYFKGTHYWPVEEISGLGGTVRSRNGIEWGHTAGMQTGDPIAGPYTGPTIFANPASTLTVASYTYDRNIVDLQAALDAAKQVTTDILAHRARTRYFKLDLTIVYKPGVAGASTNSTIASAITTYFATQYFGATIQLADLLLTVRQVAGVQNVRWTNDVPNPTDDGINSSHRVTETDLDGNPVPVSPHPNWYDVDFFLNDNELPSLPSTAIAGDTLPGLILRPRAENTFNIV